MEGLKNIFTSKNLSLNIDWLYKTIVASMLCLKGLYSLSCKTSYRQIPWSLEAARFAAEVPVKFQSDWKSLNPNLAASRLHEILP